MWGHGRSFPPSHSNDFEGRVRGKQKISHRRRSFFPTSFTCGHLDLCTRSMWMCQRTFVGIVQHRMNPSVTPRLNEVAK